MNEKMIRLSEETGSVVAAKVAYNSFKKALALLPSETLASKKGDESVETALEIIDDVLERSLVASANQAIYDSGGAMI